MRCVINLKKKSFFFLNTRTLSKPNQSISNEEAKWIVKNKKLIFWLFFACFSYSKRKAKQKAKMPFLFHKSYSYISLKRVKTNKVGLTKK
jgi:hypothetical protein